ncbi:DUF4157 domain-containing protein [Streptomyces griseoluteus]|uniref:DUF4157 domain-containing protein n=1 Tax=Streptomyces griseoluteus TaxID=29306 RepID=A0A4Z1DGV1_STRGP|nr:DUF4157 domain-containing protein [Streptomyces griseoluteus]TGN82301.1 DUF4157 domain-containing protein [Streptomyces griseoluteus]GHF10568.1 hypothetical protein GCM10017776_30400 [Streptomyces griseoluteus]
MYDHANSRAAKGRQAPAAARASGSRTVAAPAAALLALQRSAGNAAVVHMMRRAKEAAAQDAHRHGPGCGHAEDAQPVQRSAVHAVLRSGGRPLDERSRTDMEARFGADFSDVRVHTDAAARASAAQLGAAAYTSGSHIVAGPSGIDSHTLAHELTHVLQQRSGPVAGTDRGDGLRVSDPSDRFEREAETTARRVMSGPAKASAPAAASPAAGPSAGGGAVQRMHHPGKIDGEVARLVAQAEPSIDAYIAGYAQWQTNRTNFKWVMNNADLNDSYEVIEAQVGDPQGRSRADLLQALDSTIRADLTTTASETVANTRAAAAIAKYKLILGRTTDTTQWAEHQKNKAQAPGELPLDARMGRRLNTTKWSVPVNYAFMDGGIEERAVFKIVTSLGPRIENMLTSGQLTSANFWTAIEQLGDSALWDTTKAPEDGGPQAMLGHEILQLIESGYRFYDRASAFAQGSRLVAVHPDKQSADPSDKQIPLT